MRQVDAGQMEAKCVYSLTDDYQFDNASNFGKSGWMPARIRRPVFAEYENRFGSVVQRCVDTDHVDCYMNFMQHQFKGRSGRASKDTETGIITLRPHENATFRLRSK